MTRQEHLLIKLIEECCEVAKATSKALEFGLDDGCPNTGRTNLGDIKSELNDLFAIIEMLHSEGVDWKIDDAAVMLKKAKVEYWMSHAQKRGALEV